MKMEDFADRIIPTEIHYDTVVEVEMRKDTASRKFYVPAHGLNGFHAMLSVCRFLVDLAEEEYLIENDEEYADVDGDYTVLLYDDYRGTEVEVHSEGLLMSEFIGDLITCVRVIDLKQYYDGQYGNDESICNGKI